MLEQTETERILTEHLASFDILIERGVKLSRCRQDGETLRVLLEHEDGREETLAPSWLVAADGAHSTLRHLLGASFAGHAFEQTFLLADVAAEPGWPDDEIHLHATHDGLAGCCRWGMGATGSSPIGRRGMRKGRSAKAHPRRRLRASLARAAQTTMRPPSKPVAPWCASASIRIWRSTN